MLNDREKTLLYSTVRVVIDSTDLPGASIGTGFIVSVVSPTNQDESYVLVISNKHVFINPAYNISLVFTRRKLGLVEPDIGNTATISQLGFAKGYVAHPDPTVDLACINISSLSDPSHELYFRHHPQDHLLSDDADDLSIGREVFFIGYPENRYDETNNLPLFRRGCLASAPKIDFNGKKEMIIDAQVFQGSSGSPVFVASGNEHKIAGVITQTMIKNSHIQALPVGTAQGIQHPIGLGIVLKISLVHQLIKHAAQHFSKKNT